jgi:hypothetical protein
MNPALGTVGPPAFLASEFFAYVETVQSRSLASSLRYFRALTVLMREKLDGEYSLSSIFAACKSDCLIGAG